MFSPGLLPFQVVQSRGLFLSNLSSCPTSMLTRHRSGISLSVRRQEIRVHYSTCRHIRCAIPIAGRAMDHRVLCVWSPCCVHSDSLVSFVGVVIGAALSVRLCLSLCGPMARVTMPLINAAAVPCHGRGHAVSGRCEDRVSSQLGLADPQRTQQVDSNSSSVL